MSKVKGDRIEVSSSRRAAPRRRRNEPLNDGDGEMRNCVRLCPAVSGVVVVVVVVVGEWRHLLKLRTHSHRRTHTHTQEVTHDSTNGMQRSLRSTSTVRCGAVRCVRLRCHCGAPVGCLVGRSVGRSFGGSRALSLCLGANIPAHEGGRCVNDVALFNGSEITSYFLRLSMMMMVQR